MKKNLLYLALTMSIIFTSCKDDSSLTKNVNFDRTGLLSHYADHIITRHYKSLNNSIDELDSVWTKFKSSPSEVNLTILQNAMNNTYKAWQFCSVFEIGPAEQILLRANINTFPTDTFQISSNIQSQNYNLSNASNLDAKGLPALDYLFNKYNNSEDQITYLTNNKNQQYINNVLLDVKDKVEFVYSAWIFGNYPSQFVNNNGVDVGSSLGMLVNQLNFDYEIIKNPKVGIPLGKKTMGAILPEMTEAYYSGISKELILLNIESIQNNFNGNVTSTITGVGLDDYLDAVNAQHNGVNLSIKINEQLNIAKQKVSALPANLSDAIRTNPTAVEEAYNEIQKAIIYMKTDMPSALGIMITYQDNDGD
jgi:predicted lipoprotein